MKFSLKNVDAKSTLSLLVIAALILDFCKFRLLCQWSFATSRLQPASVSCYVASKLITDSPSLLSGYLILLCISGAGPIGNQSLYWIKYQGATIANENNSLLGAFFGFVVFEPHQINPTLSLYPPN
jgi:hypothetical protein